MDFPKDMDPILKHQLKHDLLVFGNCFYEEGEHGYDRIDPQKAIVKIDDHSN